MVWDQEAPSSNLGTPTSANGASRGAWDKMSTEDAKRHIEVAERQLTRVQTASWDPDDEDREDAVTWGFYAYENAVVAVAEKVNMPWKKNHWDKREIASEIFTKGYVSVDVADRLDELNELRKDVQYGEAGPDLVDYDLEDLASGLENFIEQARKFVDA